MFADRLLLVEGVTEAAVAREFGWVWAGGDADKQAFIDAVTIVAMGTKVGPWAVRLLATQHHELCSRLAVLRDSDLPFDEVPVAPLWAGQHDPEIVLVEHSHPTLEPQLTVGNQALVAAAMGDLDIVAPDPLTPHAVHELFRARHQEGAKTVPAGPAARRKASSPRR